MNYLDFLKRAKNDLKIADHIAYVTYSLVKEPKLMLSVIDSLYNSVENIINAILYYEKTYKRINTFPENINSKIFIFKNEVMKRYNIERRFLIAIEDIIELVNTRKKSPIEFKRGDKYVICTKDYKMKIINLDNIKKYINEIKLLSSKIEQIISRK